MGLDVSHDCWSGAYSAFMRWRKQIAKSAGFPPLQLMEGFTEHIITQEEYDELEKNFLWDETGMTGRWLLRQLVNNLPIKWKIFKNDPLVRLLYHSDCDGIIEHEDCLPLAQRLEEILPELPNESGGGHVGYWRDKTQRFIDGLKLAHDKCEDVEFG